MWHSLTGKFEETNSPQIREFMTDKNSAWWTSEFYWWYLKEYWWEEISQRQLHHHSPPQLMKTETWAHWKLQAAQQFGASFPVGFTSQRVSLGGPYCLHMPANIYMSHAHAHIHKIKTKQNRLTTKTRTDCNEDPGWKDSLLHHLVEAYVTYSKPSEILLSLIAAWKGCLRRSFGGMFVWQRISSSRTGLELDM